MNVSIVLPVRDGRAWLGPGLDAVLREAGDSPVIVVDDGSTDGSADLAESHGVQVLRLGGGGPYRARNAGWRGTATELVVFTDVRCRPHPGWLAGLVRVMHDPSIAVAGGDVVALTGPGPAQRYAAKWQPLAPEHGLEHPFLPFLPTCNIITRRTVLDAVGGFREMRSGGDLDFSWRAQLASLGQINYAPDAGVDWVPRATVREVVRQWYRYGSAKPRLWEDYRQYGLDIAPPVGSLKFAYGEGRNLLRGLRTNPVRQWDVEVVDRLCQWSFRRGYREQFGRDVSAG
ncbi:MAG: glycosyltransferase [Pseudorhodobacter sp.]|nr:glycosyltransferase [Frankiaceae bacterium]